MVGVVGVEGLFSIDMRTRGSVRGGVGGGRINEGHVAADFFSQTSRSTLISKPFIATGK